ncbi:DUF7619 domain-containing protein [Flavobacterium sp.]
MKKNYTNLFLFFLVLFFGHSSYGQLVANPDSGTINHSSNVQIAIQNVLGNDTLNGIPVSLSQVTITQITPTVGLTLQPNGSIVAAANTPSGTRYVEYQICEIANPGNCSYSHATVNIVRAPIVVGPDAVSISTGMAPPQIVLENILSNDTAAGIPISISDVTIYQISATGGFSLNTSNGNVMMNSSTSAGTYPLTYYYCMNTDPGNCAQGTVNITVINALRTVVAGTYQDLNADGITNVGDVINYTYSITNNSGVVISNISVTSNDVNVNGGPTIPSLNNGATNNTTFTGVYVITQADINNGYVTVSVQTNGTRSGNPFSVSTTHNVNLNLSNGIKLNAFIDHNGNGTQENGEPNFTNGSFQYQLNDNGTTHNITSSTGTHYLYETNPANSYDVGFTIDPAYASRYTIATASYANVTVPNGSGITTYNFALSVAPFNDLGLYLYGGLPPRPGFNFTHSIRYFNRGNQTITSGTVTYTKGANVSISTLPAGATATANGFTYNFTNLAPGEYRTITVTMLTPLIPTINLGDYVNSSASITVPTNDLYPGNNNATLTELVIGSWDPNDKTESHGPQIQHSTFTANDYLTYTIRFENTGTAEAINIRVVDVLDSKLDETSVKMVAASHAYVLDRVGSNLTWRFDGVNLEPSIPNNPIIGHGFIVFQVKPKPGYVIGDVIPNTASIYFDFNPAIVTDLWTTRFVLTLNTSDFVFNNFKLYPNPVQNNLTISSDVTIETVEVTSVLGQRVRSFNVNALEADIDMSGLSKGMYFVKAISNGKEKVVKVLKE